MPCPGTLWPHSRNRLTDFSFPFTPHTPSPSHLVLMPHLFNGHQAARVLAADCLVHHPIGACTPEGGLPLLYGSL